jgi:hypothetical protein
LAFVCPEDILLQNIKHGSAAPEPGDRTESDLKPLVRQTLPAGTKPAERSVAPTWHKPYAVVLLETNLDKLPPLIALAKQKILSRYMEQHALPMSSRESLDLRSAIKTLAQIAKITREVSTLRKKNVEPSDAIQASVEKEMAEPRMARSARIAESHLAAAGLSKPASSTMPGTVDKILPSSRPSQSEMAQIGIDDADQGHRDIRIENTLTGEHGHKVKLKQGARVKLTLTAIPKPLPAKI